MKTCERRKNNEVDGDSETAELIFSMQTWKLLTGKVYAQSYTIRLTIICYKSVAFVFLHFISSPVI